MKKIVSVRMAMFVLIALLFSHCDKENEMSEEVDTTSETTVRTFDGVHLSFGSAASGRVQKRVDSFDFPFNQEDVEEILMYVKLECPDGGCGAWDVFANINIEDPVSGNWWELGRFITPYGVDNSQLTDGFVFDVTDFKSLFQGSVKLKSFVEVWTSEGWLVTVDFKVTEGNPLLKYSSIVPLIDYKNNSQQIPYGETLTENIRLEGQVVIPTNAKSVKFRTTISGWGHATPNDAGGRGCAEWCFRTHVLTVGDQDFLHSMEPIGCGSNQVSPQNGNWAPDRAGWCPGKEVPIRTDAMSNLMAGESLSFEYSFEDWANDLGNGKAYYSLSTFVVLESDTPIQAAIVTE